MTDKIKLKTPEILKDAFWQLYSEKDINKIRIVEITDLAGYNRGVFYSYYKNIYEMFDAIEREIMLEIKEISHLIQSFIMDETYNQDKLAVIINNYKKNEKYLKVLFTKSDNPRFMMRIKKMLKDNLVKEAKKAGSTKENIEYYIEYYVSGMLNLLIYWFVNGSKLAVDEFSKLVIELTGLQSTQILKHIYGKA
ncbi:MAG: TetR family transcriptional regulator C-terminal domain-containing protein [Mucispirillum sp.]|uniref:TetR family transcriptional regulator C-terminal domain-containing protein n=1 Tax=Candidatus Mucispirillum faecigallinarum TaxID=2838699 RepID=A0A9D2GUT1_9BACT|nr:TetR family transcriptional regulator C-terminal domain-containing protein [Mucispirillum sp.]HIZ89095.1 TetR family transcriptional regulator C-terminal domain-containing protein [Candidatus Mucispirillum faecigallinarum]